VFNGLADWWDGVELWLAQAGFPVQFVLVMAVVVPLCLVAAWVLDKVVGKLAQWFSAARDANRSDRSS
jgi:p-aminobenzoyl-glutamate transporter AbgT